MRVSVSKANLRGSEVAGVKPFVAVLCLDRREREREPSIFLLVFASRRGERNTVMSVQNHRRQQCLKAVRTFAKSAVPLKKHKTLHMPDIIIGSSFDSLPFHVTAHHDA